MLLSYILVANMCLEVMGIEIKIFAQFSNFAWSASLTNWKLKWVLQVKGQVLKVFCNGKFSKTFFYM